MRITLLMASIALLTACSRATSAPADVKVGQSIQLAEGQSAMVSNTSVVVQFVSANDSRCPSDVVCVSAGEAVISLSLAGAAASRTDTVRLVKQPRAVTYGGFVFEATDLQPYPKSTGPVSTKTLTLRIGTAP